MSKVVAGMTLSLDGFVNDRNGSVANLYADFAEVRETAPLQASMQNTGAVVMGKRSYEMAEGDFTGYEYQVPIFVVTHHVPEQVAKGENDQLKLHFVTDGVESAIAQAKAAAGDKDVTVVGGASIIQQCLNAGLVDELHLDIMPELFGSGLRLFEHIDQQITLEKISVAEAGARTMFMFRVVR